MFSLKFLIFSAVLLVIAVVSVTAQSESNDIDYERSLGFLERNIIVDKVKEILLNFFNNVNEDCIKEGVNKCKQYWYNPVKVIQCAKALFNLENLKCLAGVSQEAFYCVKV